MFDTAKESLKSEFAQESYRRRVVTAGYVAENDFDNFLSDLNSEIDEATLTFSNEDSHRIAAIIGYFDAAESYKDRIALVPSVVVYLNNIEGQKDEETLEDLEHELRHIEESLLNDKESETGQGRGAFRSELISAMIPKSDFARQVEDKFSQEDKDSRLFGAVVYQYEKKLSPENGLMAVEEMRNRLGQLRRKLADTGKTMTNALADGDMLSYSDLVTKYGNPPAEFLIALDYNKDLSFLLETIEAIAMSSATNKSDTRLG